MSIRSQKTLSRTSSNSGVFSNVFKSRGIETLSQSTSRRRAPNFFATYTNAHRRNAEFFRITRNNGSRASGASGRRISMTCSGLTDRGTSRKKRDRDVFADPRRHVTDLADRLDEQMVLLEVDEPPRGAAHDEALPELRILGDEPFVQGADRPARRQVNHPVRLHVRDHRDVLEEVWKGVRTPTEAPIPGPEDPEARELGDDLVEVRPLQFPERPAPTHGLVGLVERGETFGHDEGDELVREDRPVVFPDDEILDLLREAPTGDRARLRDVVLVGRQDHAVGDFADPVARSSDPLDEARDLAWGVVL